MTREQEYHELSLTVGHYQIVECQGCGCLVTDTDLHDRWHTKTRSSL